MYWYYSTCIAKTRAGPGSFCTCDTKMDKSLVSTTHRQPERFPNRWSFHIPIKVHHQLGHLTRDIVEIHVAEDLILFALVSAMEKKYFLVARTRNDATVLVSFHLKAEHSNNRKHHKPCLIDFGTNWVHPEPCNQTCRHEIGPELLRHQIWWYPRRLHVIGPMTSVTNYRGENAVSISLLIH